MNDLDIPPPKRYNSSELASIGASYEPLNKWLKKVRACTDSRLNELVRGDGPREQKEMFLARHLMEEEALFYMQAAQAVRRGESTLGHGLLLYGLDQTISAPLSCDKHTCQHCGRVFYSQSSRSLYCGYRCSTDSYIKRRKERLEAIRNSKICLYCKKPFKAKRTHAIYCCSDCRVRAFLTRKKENQ